MSEEIEKLKKSHEEFVHIIAHDLSAPLRHVRDFTGLLLDSFPQSLSEEQQEYKQFIDAALSKLTVMQDDLLALSRITSRGNHFSAVPLTTTVNRVADDLGMAVPYHGNDQVVWGDAEQIALAFHHLFRNARAYARPDVPLELTVTALPIAGGIEIAVTDNGIGIEEKYFLEIFKMFRRLHAFGTFGNGAGAGLAIVEKIMARHGGHIRVQSHVGKGSTFTLYFPQKA